MSYVFFNAFKWQRRRKVEKEQEIKFRLDWVNGEPILIQGDYPWTELSIEQAWEEWGYKRVKLTGIYDHSNEIMIEFLKDGY